MEQRRKKSFEKAGGHQDKCPVVVGKACAWAIEIIWDELMITK